MTAEPCRCLACLPSINPYEDPHATPGEIADYLDHLRKLDAIGALPDPDFHPYPTSPADENAS